MMTPLHTHEVRWFAPGPVPTPVMMWFSGFGRSAAQPPRTDLYLLGTGADLGIKHRQGSLEVKQRAADLGEQNFHPQLSGIVNSWDKWSFPLASTETPADLQSERWLPVHKTRYNHYFTLSEEGKALHIPPGEIPEQGGGLELTRVRLPDETPWWTLGVEVIGPAQAQPEILTRLMEHFVSSAPPPTELTRAASLSYPAWLHTLAL